MVSLKICGLEHQNSSAYAWPCSSTHTQYEHVEMCQIQPLQVENMTTIDHETLAYAWRATAARHMRIPTLQKTWDRNKRHYLHVCVFFVTEIPGREERERKVKKGPVRISGHRSCNVCLKYATCSQYQRAGHGHRTCSKALNCELTHQLTAWLVSRSAQGSSAPLANTRVQPPPRPRWIHVRK